MSWTHHKQLDERSLRYFMVVCEEGSVRAAAARLGIAASAVARKLSDLEEDLGIKLVNRSAKGMSPTALGQHFQRYLTQRHAGDTEIMERMLEMTRLKRGEVRVALGGAFMRDFITAATVQFRARHPEIRFSIQVMDTEAIMAAIEEDAADIAIAFNPPAPHNALLALQCTSDFAAVVPAGWLPDDDRPYRLSELQAFPCALLTRGFSARRAIDAAERKAELRLEVVMETNALEVLTLFVENGLGITFLPEFAIPAPPPPGLRVVALLDQTLKGIPVSVFLSNLGKDQPTTLEILNLVAGHMALFRGPGVQRFL